jgi:tetratricopeptide (TPR) repeat protein
VQRRAKLLVLTTILAAAGVVAVASRQTRTRPRVIAPAHSDAEVRDLDIAFYERRVQEDTFSAADRQRLASLYLQRARETGNYSDYERAELLARHSLAQREAHNSFTYQLLATSLLAEHRFTDALAAARTLDSIEPGIPSQQAQLAEIELELGNYAAAGALFDSVKSVGDRPSITARLARWHEIEGRPDVAKRLLALAIRNSQMLTDLPKEQISWFYYRLGELELKSGRLAQADSAFNAGLARFPGDYRILGAFARLAAARGDWQGAIDYGARAIAIQLDPATLGTMSDAYAALGDTAQAAQYAKTMTMSALRQPGPIHRAWGLFLLDHDRDVARVLAKAHAELETRRDVYGYDLYAWALYKSGRYREAREASDRALSRRTQDAQLFFHAGMIARAMGDSAAAKRDLDEALRINPFFGAANVRAARLALQSLGGGMPGV